MLSGSVVQLHHLSVRLHGDETSNDVVLVTFFFFLSLLADKGSAEVEGFLIDGCNQNPGQHRGKSGGGAVGGAMMLTAGLACLMLPSAGGYLQGERRGHFFHSSIGVQPRLNISLEKNTNLENIQKKLLCNEIY